MSDTDRVKLWRQRMKDEGKVPMTIWLSHQEKQRLEDLALAWRRSPSEMIQEAFAKFHPVRPHSTDTVTDILQLQALIQDMLARLLSLPI
jgi:hypothetical protein